MARPGADDQGLVARAAAGDERALRAIYERHSVRIHRFVRDLLGDRAGAADATQETFARAFRSLDRLRASDRLSPWLFGIARNVVLEHQKTQRKRGPQHPL